MPELDADNPNGLLTVKEVSKYLRIPLPTVYCLIGKGKLPGVTRIGGRWRIKKSALDTMLSEEVEVVA